jgi:cell division septation protein DedD
MAGSKKNGGDVVLESRHLVGLFVLMVAIFGVVFLLGYELGRNQYGDQVRASNVSSEDNSAAKPNAKVSPLQPGVQPPFSQPGSKKSAAAITPKDSASNVAPDAASGPPADYDFYKLGQPNQPPARLAPPPKAVVSKPPTPAPAKNATPTISVPGKTTAVAPAAAAVKPQPVPSKPTSTVKPQQTEVNGPLIPRGSILLQVSAMTKESDALAMAQQLQQKKFPTIVIPPGADKFYHVQVGPYADAKSADAARAALEKAGFKTIVKR